MFQTLILRQKLNSCRGSDTHIAFNAQSIESNNLLHQGFIGTQNVHGLYTRTVNECHVHCLRLLAILYLFDNLNGIITASVKTLLLNKLHRWCQNVQLNVNKHV